MTEFSERSSRALQRPVRHSSQQRIPKLNNVRKLRRSTMPRKRRNACKTIATSAFRTSTGRKKGLKLASHTKTKPATQHNIQRTTAGVKSGRCAALRCGTPYRVIRAAKRSRLEQVVRQRLRSSSKSNTRDSSSRLPLGRRCSRQRLKDPHLSACHQ